jgi:hypothetical protein
MQHSRFFSANATQLARVVASAVLAGEINLMAALASHHLVGSTNALVTFICLLCTLRTQISRSICNYTHYSNNHNNNNLTINMQLHTQVEAHMKLGRNEVDGRTTPSAKAAAEDAEASVPDPEAIDDLAPPKA